MSLEQCCFKFFKSKFNELSSHDSALRLIFRKSYFKRVLNPVATGAILFYAIVSKVSVGVCDINFIWYILNYCSYCSP